MAIAEGATVTGLPDREPTAVKVARMDAAITDMAHDLAELKESSTTAVDLLQQRMNMIEDVKVRALEDWRLAEKIREQERDKQRDREAAAAADAKAAAADAHATALVVSNQSLSRRQFWIGTTLTSTVVLLGALIEAHVI